MDTNTGEPGTGAGAISLRRVVKRYGSIVAVDGLDLEVPAGVCFGLLGPNGAGKSTTMRMLTAQTLADEGEISVLGYELPRESKQSRLEMDLSLLFPTRFSYGLMLGAKLLSLYGRDTDLAFGHLGLINIMGWADPERGISGGLITSGKALVYPEVHRFYGLMQRIASEVPKVPEPERPF